MSRPAVVLRRGRVKPLLGRHPWVFAGSIQKVVGEPESGAVVDVVGPDGRFIAAGTYSEHSQLRVRAFSWTSGADYDEALIAARLDSAIGLRHDALGLPSPETDGLRLVHSEADGLPGLIVDRYADVLAIQLSTAATDARRELICDLLQRRLRPVAIVETSDKNREHEGLPPAEGLRRGALPEALVVRERGLRLPVDLLGGQKTGLYFDQRDNRARVEAMAKGKRVLDAFSYQGGFALSAARGGAASVLAIDSSAPALAAGEQAAAANGLEGIVWRKQDVYRSLGGMRREGQLFDLVILDPPRYAQRRQQLGAAKKKYTELAGLGLTVTAKGGVCVVCSCSGLLDEAGLEAIVRDAAARLGRHVRVFHRGGQSGDHPTSVFCPEGRYLKALFCHVD